MDDMPRPSSYNSTEEACGKEGILEKILLVEEVDDPSGKGEGWDGEDEEGRRRVAEEGWDEGSEFNL